MSGLQTFEALFLMLLATSGVSSNTTSKTGTAPATNVVVEEPEFTDVIENVTVPAGRNVKLACSVKNLGSYKVAWMHFEQSAILTVHNHVITRNPRISVTHDKHDKHKTWFLHISNVQEEDKGRYMCQINTVTAKTQFGYLHVVVPPNIDDSLSSSDVIVREGSNVTLKCRATGSPTPTVKWKRDDNSKIAINRSLNVLEWEGNSIEITKISRLDMGAYLCIASNGVPPTVSKRIKVSVDFPPMLWIPHQLVGVPLYFNVTLECFTEAHPTSLNYWTREDGHMIHDSKKYRTESNVGMPIYKTHMRLHIYNIQQTDYGTYKCVAKNPRGETDGTIRLYTSTPPTTSPGPPTTESYSDLWSNRNLNDSAGGLPHHHGGQHSNSYSGHVVDKNSKYSSNLNEIDRSEQKSFDTNIIYWPPETNRNNQGATTTTTRSTLSIILNTSMLLLARFSLQ
ncbi:lachesin [Anopheles gambiae]|uniref:lachesin n=1 Tax=Anopheles gambiae TaxID=7165 RepID=UPI002AC968AD|nr:lachesin [Anopheles gambiae]XP_061513628.1 lachesin [Anopheles gambiae]XP_061513629.1 lachesin [Anopheles gambiae]XP_061513631.1 lachesin [Anopheles gambiae]XP_061513632.1 lachesin [Anopheles gambiae]